MKEYVAHFRKWGTFAPVFTETMRHGEYALDDMSRLSPFGKKLLRFFWCDYRPLTVELVWRKNGVRIMTKSMDIFECIPGTIPSFIRRKHGT